jgi:hypothetical protein
VIEDDLAAAAEKLGRLERAKTTAFLPIRHVAVCPNCKRAS